MVTVLAIGAYWVITAVAGALAAGLVRTPLRLEERIAVAVIGGTVLGSLLAFLAALVLGMGTPAALAGPLLLGALALAAALVAGDPRQPWGASLTDAAQRWHSRELWPVAALTAVAAIGFTVAFGHGFFPGGDGSIMAGYPTTWADWSLHATSANSFAVGHNLPPHDPIFSGTAYRQRIIPFRA